jgi:hypothetical protein
MTSAFPASPTSTAANATACWRRRWSSGGRSSASLRNGARCRWVGAFPRTTGSRRRPAGTGKSRCPKSAPDRIRNFARERGWRHLRLLSSQNNTYNRDYHAETPTGDQIPILNVFVRDGEEIRHFWASELMFAPREEGIEPRHVDSIWPIWNVLDMTRQGRGSDRGFPGLSY